MFIVGGANSLKNSAALAPAAAPVADNVVPLAQKAAPQLPIPRDPQSLVRLNGAIHVVAGLALATGRAPRLSAAVLAATVAPTTAAGHRFWEESDPGAKANQRVHFVKNLSILGGLLLAAVDTDGKPGMAWRAKHAATDVKREAQHVRATARREAKHAARAARREAKRARAQIG